MSWMTLGGKIGVVKWSDTKDVFVCSNSIPVDRLTTIERKQRGGSRKDLSCPDAIKTYNDHYYYVDMRGQNIQQYDTNRRCVKWWHPVMFWALDSMIFNAYLIRKYQNRRGMSDMTHKQFRENLANGLLNQMEHVVDAEEPPRKELGSLGHYPVWGEKRGYCVGSCGTRSTMRCVVCGVALCKECWSQAEYHPDA